MQIKKLIKYIKVLVIGMITIIVFNFIIGVIFLNFGTPIGTLVSMVRLRSYAKAIYGTDVSYKGMPKFDFKSSVYYQQLVTKNDEDLTLTYKPWGYTIIDTNYQRNIEPDYLQKKIYELDEVLGRDIYLPTPYAFYGIDANQNFNKPSLKTKDGIYLLGIINTDVTLTPEESKEKLFEIITFIYRELDDKYNFSKSQIIYFDVNGGLEADISSKESKRAYKSIEGKIKEAQLGTLEVELIEKLKAVRDGKLRKDELIVRDRQN